SRFSLISVLSSCSPAHSDLLSFPTRRSSDLWGVLTRIPKLCLSIFFSGTTHEKKGRLEIDDISDSDRNRKPCTWNGSGSNSKTIDRKSTRLNSSHVKISYAVFCLKKKKKKKT